MVRINSRTCLGAAGRPGLPFRIFRAQNRRKPFPCQPMTVEALIMKTPDCQSFQTPQSQTHKNRICRGQFRSLDRALQNAELVTQGEDLELKRRTAAEGSADGPKSAEQRGRNGN